MSLNVLFVVSEVEGFAKTGGLADVGYALPKALAEIGHNVVVVMPRYYVIDKNTLEHIPISSDVLLGESTLRFGAFKSKLLDSDVDIYFVDYEAFFGRKGLYDDGFVAYHDNAERFIFFSKAALELSKSIGFKPDIVHLNDWQTAAAGVVLRHDDYFRDSAVVLTIHNLQHQGFFDKQKFGLLNVDWSHFNPFEFEALGGLNLLKGGIALADAITTVSKKYSQEIQTPQFGFGLHEHIKAHSFKLFGILNGVDYKQWNPKTDRFIKSNYDIDSLENKQRCKEELVSIFNLSLNDNTPLIGFIGRLVKQKGIELLAASIEDVLKRLDVGFVLLGAGELWAEQFFSNIAARFRDRFGCFIGYSYELAHKIEAGCDMFLMPSLFEPCGLNQIYSLRYATLPIVRAVGGLDDTVKNYDTKTGEGWGFKFWDATPKALFDTVKWAISVFKENKKDFTAMQKRAMQLRFDWKNSAKNYVDVYSWARIYKRLKNG
ncbi:glycogen synthase [Hippea maritima]|uniref:Glycogen synthase n=1 Tax=Hippea maritima (strain ATCC 700847 / DSM 10411 / MH2) TaxID=760142 RepID=F2LVY9_HIPMA|nr:glycogen/starch synthase [Hippea maritima]AEA33923.1 Glycogen synthase [Hippea maritima DSM 10411]